MLIFSQSALCPNCASIATHGSIRKGFLEQILHAVFFPKPFRSDVCDERHFRIRFLTPRSAHQHPMPPNPLVSSYVCEASHFESYRRSVC
jgi:hypothetical protein